MRSAMSFAALLFSLQRRFFVLASVVLGLATSLLVLDFAILPVLLFSGALWIALRAFMQGIHLVHRGDYLWIWFGTPIDAKAKVLGLLLLISGYTAFPLLVLFVCKHIWYALFPTLTLAQSNAMYGGYLSRYIVSFFVILCIIPLGGYAGFRLRRYAFISSLIVFIGLLFSVVLLFILMIPISVTTEYLRMIVSWVLHPWSEFPALFREGYLMVAIPTLAVLIAIDVVYLWARFIYLIGHLEIEWSVIRA